MDSTPTLLNQLAHGAAATELNVIGMGSEGEDGRHGLSRCYTTSDFYRSLTMAHMRGGGLR